MNNSDKNVFIASVGVPFFIATDEQVENVPIEPYLEALVTSGYMTKKEAVSWVITANTFASMPVFFFDTFLNTFRQQQEAANKPKIILPNKELVLPPTN